jgi:hypothetical protein
MLAEPVIGKKIYGWNIVVENKAKRVAWRIRVHAAIGGLIQPVPP